MSRTSPLVDCTYDTIQAMNRHANLSTTGMKLFIPSSLPFQNSGHSHTTPRLRRHNPYASKLLAPEDSFEFQSSMHSSPLLSSARPSPLNWEARAFEPAGLYGSLSSTSYTAASLASLSMDAQVRRSLFGDSPVALAGLSDNVESRSALPPPPPERVVTPPTSAPAPASTTAKVAPPHASPSKKAMCKVYAGGRPVVLPRYDNEVTVQLLSRAEATFVITDMCALLPLEEGTREVVGLTVVVEGDRGEDLGVVTAVLRAEVSPTKSDKAAAATEASGEGETKEKTSAAASARPLPRVYRAATAQDLQQRDALPQLEEEALAYCHACLQEVHLAVPIAVDSVVFQFDRKKLTVRYTSDAYVDFNDLTRMLHKKFNCRIWMDQLNRDAVAGAEKRGRRTEHGGSGGKRAGNGGGSLSRRGAMSKRKEH